MSKEIRVFVDMDNVLCDYNGAYNKALNHNPDIKYPQSQYGFFLNLEPKTNALKMFWRFLNIHFDVRILTSPSVMNPMSYTEKRYWVEKHIDLEAAKNMILAPDKSILIGDYLIDDYDNHPISKQQEFKGELIHFGSDKFPDWISVIDYLKDKHKYTIK